MSNNPADYRPPVEKDEFITGIGDDGARSECCGHSRGENGGKQCVTQRQAVSFLFLHQ